MSDKILYYRCPECGNDCLAFGSNYAKCQGPCNWKGKREDLDKEVIWRKKTETGQAEVASYA